MAALLDLLPVSWLMWLGWLEPAVAYVEPTRPPEVVQPRLYSVQGWYPRARSRR